MSKLKELIEEKCFNGVEFRNLSDCCNILDNKRKPVTKSSREKGKYPYYGANGIQDYVSDYIFDGTFVLVGEDGSVITPSGNPVVNWAEGKIWVNNHAHIIEEIDGVLLRYLYYYIQSVNVRELIHGNIPKLNQGDFKNIRVAVPPLEVQQEIVHVLDNFSFLSAELSAELKARQKQYEYYRNKLLSFEETAETLDTLHTHTHTHGYFNEQKIKYIKLSDMAEIYDGTHQTPHYRDNGISFISVENINNIYGSKKYISKEDYNKYKIKPRINDLFMTRIGTIGKCAVYDKKIDLAYYVSLALIRPNNDVINTKYLKYVIESSIGQSELRKRTLVHAVPIKVNKDEIGKIILPVPSLKIQEEIIKILDKFDKLTNDILEGLPAEIKARQKQYEYYRNKLLTFKELV